MATHFITGDLFANRFKVSAFGHGCNCQGSMGAGIAVEFKKQYPLMYEEYRRRCKFKPREFNLGDAFLWKDDDKTWVFNLATQERYGRNGGATYPAVEAALTNMKSIADQEQISTIAIPRIAAGYGRLSWEKVRAIIENIFNDWSGDLYIYEDYQPE